MFLKTSFFPHTASTIVTVSGEGFSDSPTDMRVEIGGYPCQILSTSGALLTCQVGRLPVGENHVAVYVANKGKALSLEL